jgi:hypothetical protein
LSFPFKIKEYSFDIQLLILENSINLYFLGTN